MVALSVVPAIVKLKSEDWQIELLRKYTLQCPTTFRQAQGEMMIPLTQAHLLIDALRSLGALAKPPSLIYAWPSTPPVTGMSHLLMSLGIGRFDLKGWGGGDLQPTLFLDAISISNFPLHSLNLGGNVSGQAICCQVFDLSMSNSAQTLDCWSRLTALSLNLARPKMDWSSRSTLALRKLLAATPNLEKLHLDTDEDVEDEVLGDSSIAVVASSVSSQKLSSVTFTSLKATAVELTEFLMKHRKTLRTLELVAVFLPKNELWTSVFKVIIRNLEVETLKLGRLWAGWNILVVRPGEDNVDEDDEDEIDEDNDYEVSFYMPPRMHERQYYLTRTLLIPIDLDVHSHRQSNSDRRAATRDPQSCVRLWWSEIASWLSTRMALNLPS